MSPEVERPPQEEVTMSDDFDVITGPAAPLRPVPPASLPSAREAVPPATRDAPATANRDNGSATERH